MRYRKLELLKKDEKFANEKTGMYSCWDCGITGEHMFADILKKGKYLTSITVCDNCGNLTYLN